MNLDHQRFIFRRIYQEDNMDFELFIERLYKQMRKCSFEDNASQIKDQIIENCSIDELRQAAFREYLSLHRIISFGINHQRNQRRRRGDFSESYTFCTRCGYKTHNQLSVRCPAIHHHCKRCSINGHFEQMCLLSDEFLSARKRAAGEDILHERQKKIVIDPIIEKLSNSSNDNLPEVEDISALYKKIISQKNITNDKIKKNQDFSQTKNDSSPQMLLISQKISSKELSSTQKSGKRALEIEIPSSTEKSVSTSSVNKSFNQIKKNQQKILQSSVLTAETSSSLNKNVSRSSQTIEVASAISSLGKTATPPSLEIPAQKSEKSSDLNKSRNQKSAPSQTSMKSSNQNLEIIKAKIEPSEKVQSKTAADKCLDKNSIHISTVVVELHEIFDEKTNNFDSDESSQEHLSAKISRSAYFEAIEM